MAHQNIIFQQKVNQRGESEFRLKFGRQKAIVFKKHMESGFYYVDLYDNRPGRADRIGLGLDELDQLISVRAGLDSLKQCFHETLVEHQKKGGVSQRPPTPPATGVRFTNQQLPSTTLTPYITVERKPLVDVNCKRPASTTKDACPANATKIPKFSEPVYENITPTHSTNFETDFTADIYQDLFQSPMN